MADVLWSQFTLFSRLSARNSLMRISALGVDGGVLFFFLECPGERFFSVSGLQDQYIAYITGTITS